MRFPSCAHVVYAELLQRSGEIEAKVKDKIEKRSEQLQALVNGLATENMELKGRMAKVELGLDDLKRMFERMLSELQEA